MMSFKDFLNEAIRTDILSTNADSAKMDKEKTFTENYKLIEKAVNSKIKKLSKAIITDKEQEAFNQKVEDVKTVLKGYEILAKRLDKQEAHKDEITAIKNKFHFLKNFIEKE